MRWWRWRPLCTRPTYLVGFLCLRWEVIDSFWWYWWNFLSSLFKTSSLQCLFIVEIGSKWGGLLQLLTGSWRLPSNLLRNDYCFGLIDWLIDLFIVLNTTFSNISAISWGSVLVVEEAGVPGENQRPWASNW
jgi:hypothetical protein